MTHDLPFAPILGGGDPFDCESIRFRSIPKLKVPVRTFIKVGDFVTTTAPLVNVLSAFMSDLENYVVATYNISHESGLMLKVTGIRNTTLSVKTVSHNEKYYAFNIDISMVKLGI